MPVTPTGMLSTQVDRLRHTVAGSATFRSWTSTASETLALARVLPAYTDGAATLPIAWVEWQKFRRDLDGFGSQNWWDADDANALMVGFRASISDTDPADALYAFTNKIGAILTEMEALFGTSSTYFDGASYEIIEGPERSDEDESASIGAFYEVLVAFRYRKTGGP